MSSAQTIQRRIGRAVTSVPRNGLRGTLARTRHWVVRPLLRRVYLFEEHVWVSVPMRTRAPELPDGYVLRHGTAADLDALARTGGISPAVARAHLERDATLYVAWAGDELAFSIWVHRDAVPAVAAPGGMLDLPDGVVSFEDAIAAPAHRRTGIAQAVFHHAAVEQVRAGARLLFTRFDVGNAIARRWSAKMGHADVAGVRVHRIGPLRRARVTPLAEGDPVAALLAAQL
jgi:GNAT superfamily N-acetyltransferase